MTHIVKVKYVAAVPTGHVVRIVPVEARGLFGGWGADEPLVLDETHGILWGSESLPEAMHAGDLDLERHSRGVRRVANGPEIRGLVVACAVRTKGWGEHNWALTTLHVEVEPGEGHGG